MSSFRSILRLTLITFSIFWFSSNYANEHKTKKGPELEYFGSLTCRDIGEVRNFKRDFVANLGSGNWTIANGDMGKITAPCADFGNAQKNFGLI